LDSGKYKPAKPAEATAKFSEKIPIGSFTRSRGEMRRCEIKFEAGRAAKKFQPAKSRWRLPNDCQMVAVNTSH